MKATSLIRLNKTQPQSTRSDFEIQEKGIELPPGVTKSDWNIEKVRFQNPRIRSYIGCNRLIEEALDSNYAILHCSRPQLHKTWHQVRRICKLIRYEISPTLKESSTLPVSTRPSAKAKAHTTY